MDDDRSSKTDFSSSETPSKSISPEKYLQSYLFLPLSLNTDITDEISSIMTC